VYAPKDSMECVQLTFFYSENEETLVVVDQHFYFDCSQLSSLRYFHLTHWLYWLTHEHGDGNSGCGGDDDGADGDVVCVSVRANWMGEENEVPET